ncbi:MAG TPA: hypothetical protein PKK26_13395 [Candidatus Wallbacteria bacterium]|nr:hypothetical protein [Candidatus Wallbacteria bacterium]
MLREKKVSVIAKSLVFVLLMSTFLIAEAAYAHEKNREYDRRNISIVPPDNYSDKYFIDAGNIARVSILIDGQRTRIYCKNGEYFIEGREGRHYSLLIVSRTDGRIKVVSSVDGLDVVDGSSRKGYDRMGHIINGYGSANIRGWRISDNEVASFCFGPISESYAMKMDRPSNIGVINFAFFREKEEYVEPPIYIDRGMSEYEKRENSGGAERKVLSDTGYSSSPKERVPSQSIGTEFGESRYSSVKRVDFEERTSYPEHVININYASHEDLVKRGVFGGGDIIIINDEHFIHRDSHQYSTPPSDWRKK